MIRDESRSHNLLAIWVLKLSQLAVGSMDTLTQPTRYMGIETISDRLLRQTKVTQPTRYMGIETYYIPAD